MKVLFAVSNDNITTSVVNKFQQKYKEIVTTKSVYYFNAIVNELKRDKEYNAIVIEEDLEPISNNNYEKIDKFLSEKLDNISDEASRPTGEDIPIILICSDRRTKSDQLLRQLFSMSIYNALVGNDRSLDKVCDLMKKPRNKKDAKQYYEIESDQVEYESHKDEIVSEEQIQSILNYYKKIGTNEKKCVQAFERISKQYDNTQLRIIVKFLPIDVKAILEAYSPIYQKLMSNGTVLSNGKYNEYKPRNAKKPEKLDFITKDVSEQATNLSKPVVIPSNMNVQNGMQNEQTNLGTNMPHQSSTNPNNHYQPQMPQQSAMNQNSNYQPQMPQQSIMNQNSNYQSQDRMYNPYAQQMPNNDLNREQQPYNPYAQQMGNPYMSQMPYGNMMQQPPFFGQQNMQQPYNPYNPYNNAGQPSMDFEQNINSLEQETQRAEEHNNMQDTQMGRLNNSVVQEPQQPNNTLAPKLQEHDNMEVQNSPKENAQTSSANETDILGVEPITPMKPISTDTALVEPKNETHDIDTTPIIKEHTDIIEPNTIETYNHLPSTEDESEDVAVEEVTPMKRRRGRPRKVKPEEIVALETQNIDSTIEEATPVKRRRGRPRKVKVEETAEQTAVSQDTQRLPGLQSFESIEPLKKEADEITDNIDTIQSIEPTQNTPSETPQSVENTQPAYGPAPIKEESGNSINLYDLDINDNEDTDETYNNNITNDNSYNNNNNISRYNSNINNINNNFNGINNSGNINDIYGSNYPGEHTMQQPFNATSSNTDIYNSNPAPIDEDAPYLPMTNDSFGNEPFTNPISQPSIQPNTNETELINNIKTDSQPTQSTTLAGRGKIVAFVGTSKNGTSFIVNSIAQLLSESGVNTAVLDLTQNKNSYYMFTDNDANKTKIATESLKQLEMGQTAGLMVKNNMTVFTALPGDTTIQQINYENVLKNVSNSFEVVLLDCDYATNSKCFEMANEIYLIQSMDAFTIQPLTKFLSELKAKNILDENKLKIVINKYLKLKKINAKMIVGGMSTYNEPSMTLQRDLFNPKKIETINIPFDEQTYTRYLESIAMCELTLSGYSSNVLEGLEKLKNMVYPLVAGESRIPNNNFTYNNYAMNNNQGYQYQNQMNSQQFTNNMNETLNKMRNNNY